MIDIFDFQYPGLLLLFKWFTLDTHSLTDLISHHLMTAYNCIVNDNLSRNNKDLHQFSRKTRNKNYINITQKLTYLVSIENNMTKKSIKWNQFEILLFPRNHLSENITLKIYNFYRINNKSLKNIRNDSIVLCISVIY